MLVPMTVKVLRVELPRTAFEEITARAGGAAIGAVVCDALRASLPALVAMSEPRLATGSSPQIAIGIDTGVAALRRIAEHTPPPARFTQSVQVAVPTELWAELDRERQRLGMTFDAIVAWAWRRRPHA